MVKHLGWTNQEAIGKAIRSDGNERVIGVFSDFNALSLHKPVDNFVLDMLQNPLGAAALTRYMAIRVNTDNYDPFWNISGIPGSILPPPAHSNTHFWMKN